MRKELILLLSTLALMLLDFCKEKEPQTPDPIKTDPIVAADTFVMLNYSVSNLPYMEGYGEQKSRGVLENGAIDEASGIAVSRSNPERIWVHNDSGDPNRVFVIGSDSKSYGFFWLRGASNRDWEDMAIGPGPMPGRMYLYLADIGDNNAVHSSVVIYRFPEPDIRGLDSINNSWIEEGVERFEFRYPDGPRDAETLMIDPWTKDLYIVSKRDFRSRVYKAKYPYTSDGIDTLERVAQLPFNLALAGEISEDGKLIVIKTARNLYCWVRTEGQSVLDALKKQPVLLPYTTEPQGEAFAWNVRNEGYYTLSEQNGTTKPVLYYYPQK